VTIGSDAVVIGRILDAIGLSHPRSCPRSSELNEEDWEIGDHP
jgi:hypothetical protein